MLFAFISGNGAPLFVPGSRTRPPVRLRERAPSPSLRPLGLSAARLPGQGRSHPASFGTTCRRRERRPARVASAHPSSSDPIRAPRVSVAARRRFGHVERATSESEDQTAGKPVERSAGARLQGSPSTPQALARVGQVVAWRSCCTRAADKADDKGKDGYETEPGTTSVVVQLHLNPLRSLEPMGSLSEIRVAGR